MKCIESWSKYLEAQEYAPNTVDLYTHCVGELLGNTEPATVTPQMVEKWMIEHKDWAPTTKRWHYAAVKNFFKYLVDGKIIPESPADILPSVTHRKRVDESTERTKEDRVYSTEALTQMLQFKDIRFKSMLSRDQAIIALMAATGMRASEVSWLNIGQILNRQGSTIFAIRKGQSIRKIVVAEFAFKYIDEYLKTRSKDPDAPLFLTRDGNRIDRHTIYAMLSVRQKALGLRTGTHNIRYTVLNAIERNADPVVARDIAGQKSISITNNYMVSNEAERTAAIDALPWADKF